MIAWDRKRTTTLTGFSEQIQSLVARQRKQCQNCCKECNRLEHFPLHASIRQASFPRHSWTTDNRRDNQTFSDDAHAIIVVQKPAMWHREMIALRGATNCRKHKGIFGASTGERRCERALSLEETTSLICKSRPLMRRGTSATL